MSLLDLQSLLPQLILALGGTTVLLLGAWVQNRRLWLIVGMFLALFAALAAGVMEPPLAEVAGMYSTSLYARFCTVLWSLIIAATLLLSCRYADLHRFGGGEYAALLLFAGAGMSLLSAATSLIGLFLGLEAFTLVLYVLIAFNRTDNRGAEAGLKYLVFGAVATGFLTFGIALIYTASGSFHMLEALSGLQVDGVLRPIGLAGWAMLLVAIGFKISLVPFHLWTPDVYQGSPAPISGLLATAAKGAVLTALLPLLAFMGDAASEIKNVLWLLAIITMLAGTFAALPQTNLKRMLAYSSIVHMGYLLIALLVGGADGGQALLFYLVVYCLATFGAFGVITSFALETGEIQDYDDLRGLGYLHPRRSIVLAAFMFSLAGIPPLAGFFAKFGLFQAALRNGYPELAVIGVFVSLVSVYYYLRPIIVLFMQDRSAYQLRSGSYSEYFLLAGCFIAILALGIYPGPLLNLVAQVLP
ncbi:MAG: NADH-quinone oxidoreductase subunit N [Desulfuromusa sp.]|jgi:NADH-quinone oxidoreductase subunit N|nr:NADH-quinone oxidoreductase subunit N [Desulfuromusa sp.]